MTPDPERLLWHGTAYGTPAPQGSKSVDRRGIMYEQNRRSRPWRKVMVETFVSSSPAAPIDEPVEVRATFVLPRPKRPRFKVPGVKPDTDKLQRNLGDALEAAGILRDDSRIVEWHVRKVYATERLAPRVTAEVLRYTPASWPLMHALTLNGEHELLQRIERVLLDVETGQAPADAALDDLVVMLGLGGTS